MTSISKVAPAPELTEPPGAGAASPWSRFAPWIVVTLAVAWGLWELRPELRAVPYLDDSSLHEQMVRFAATRIRQGHLPLTSWFPSLGLGSPQFLHYQSLPSMLTGAIGTVVDPDTAFRWSLYLLLALWPLAVYWSGRLFGLGRWTAASAAAVAPFLASAAGIGYETKAYVWVGYGVWTQLWASWTLPLAWGFTYRAVSSLRAALPAVLFIMVTVALHYETGYLAFVPLVVWPFIVPSDLWRRLGRSLALGAAALAASAWVIVPLLDQAHWAARNEVLEGTGLENGYGARQILSWLFSGQLYDAGRWPVVTVLVGAGIVACVRRWRTSLAGRALVSIWVVTLLMTFGRTTFGALYDVLPGSSDIFIRRFQMGVQLSGILLAGIGIVAVGRLVLDAALHLLPEERRGMGVGTGGARDRRGAVHRGAGARARAGLERAGHLRHAQCDQHRAAGGRRCAAGPPDRRAARLRRGPPPRPRLRRPADQLGTGLPRGRRPGVQVPREQGRRRGRVHAPDGVAHDRSRVLLRRHQPGRLPALRHRVHHHPRRHGAAGAGRQGPVLGHLLPVGAARPGLHPRVRHDRRAHRHAGRRGLAERRPAGLAAPRRAA